MSLTVKVDGDPIYGHSPPVFEWLADGGCGVASWMMSPGVPMGPIVEGALVEVSEAGYGQYRGRIESVDQQTGGVRCRGIWRDAEGLPALDGSGAATLSVADAITRGRALGWAVQPSSLIGAAPGVPGSPQMVSQVLSAYALANGARVGVDGTGDVFMRTIETEPDWVITPREVTLSGFGLGRKNAIAGRYYDEAGVLQTTYRPWPLPEVTSCEPLDLTYMGKVPVATVNTFLDAVLARVKPEARSWLGGLEIHLSQITTAAGGPLTSWLPVKAGDVVQIRNLNAAQRSTTADPFLNVELGRIVITGGSDVATLEAVNTLPTSFEDAFAAVKAA